MTDDLSSPIARRPVLELSVDLGDHPPLAHVAASTVALNQVWQFALRLSQGSPEFPASWHPEFAAMLQAYRPEEYGYLADEYQIRPPDLVVRRMNLASPWETVLTTAAGHSAVLMYGGAALITLERILKMLMDWQNHRLGLEERRQALNDGSEPPVLLGDIDDLSPEAAPELGMAIDRFVGKYDRLEAAPPEVRDQVYDFFKILTDRRIRRVELHLEDEEGTST